MTIEKFREMLNSSYGIEHNWPKELIVDSDTYANVCHHILWRKSMEINGRVVQIGTGRNGGIMFKGIELILRRE